jgi:hypothetical protein
MKANDTVIVNTWAYALTKPLVSRSATLMSAGSVGVVERVVDNVVIVKYTNGRYAPVPVSSVILWKGRV